MNTVIDVLQKLIVN